jgi:SHS family lactate transporter-like MFS transporter
MGGILQGMFGLGFALASLAYWLLFDAIGWRGLLWIGILPALLCVYIRYFVKESAVWVENRKRQRDLKQEVRAPLMSLFKPALLANTLTACWWMASLLVAWYSVYGLFATWLQTEFKVSPAAVATPVLLSNLASFAGCGLWGWVADRIGRRWSMIVLAIIGSIVAPVYLLPNDLAWIIAGFVIQGFFVGSIVALNPSYLSERFPTEVRSTASGFCYHFGAVVGSFVPPVISYLAIEQHMGFGSPMLVGTVAGCASVVIALLISPETKGKVLGSDLMTHEQHAPLAAETLGPLAPTSI